MMVVPEPGAAVLLVSGLDAGALSPKLTWIEQVVGASQDT